MARLLFCNGPDAVVWAGGRQPAHEELGRKLLRATFAA